MDIREAITAKIIALMSEGVEKWRAGWAGASHNGLPTNGKTGEAYRGVNVLLFWAAAVEAGYRSNVWMTYKQASEIGAQVRKGEKGTQGVYFEMMQKKGSGKDGSEAEFFPMCKPFWVFNVAQIDGLPEHLILADDFQRDHDPIPAADQLIEATGAHIVNGASSPFYNRESDKIHMPDREKFFVVENYYATKLHELIHWTGHTSRLDRAFGKRFGDAAYAFEELVAELGASFLGARLGLTDAMIEDHASYIDHWIEILKNDKTAIFTAAKQAGLACDWITGEERGHTQERKAAA